MRTLVVLTWISTIFPLLLAAPQADPRTTYKVSRWDEAWRPQRFGRSGRGDTKDGWRPQRFGRGRYEQGWRPQRFGRNEGLAGLREVLDGEAFPLLQMTRTDLRHDLPGIGYTPGTAHGSLRALPLLRLYDRGALQLINGAAKQSSTNPPSLRMIRAAAESLQGFARGGDQQDEEEMFAPPRSTDDWLAEIQRLGLRGRKRRDVS